MASVDAKRRLALYGAAPAGSGLRDAARPIDRVTRPFYAVWEVTLRCDLSCRHCSSRAGRARDDELTTREALDLVGALAHLGVEEVTLIGGEAYLRDDWLEIIRAIRGRGMRCTLVTGGRGFSGARARAAKDAGLQSVSVSVDGLEASHDALRGLRGSFDGALAAIDAVGGVGMQVTANTQIARRNVRDVPELFGRLLDAHIAAWQPQITVPMGRAADEADIVIEPFQMLEVMPMLARLKSLADAAGVVFWPGNNVGYFGPHEAHLRDSTPGCHRGSCGAGRVAIGIESNGNIKGCPSLPSHEYVGGNVRTAPLEAIWERAPALDFACGRVARTPTSLEPLQRALCYCAEDCLGVRCCRAATSATGRPGNNPYCHHRALTLLRQGLRERIVLRERPPGQSFDLGIFDIVEEAWIPGGASCWASFRPASERA